MMKLADRVRVSHERILYCIRNFISCSEGNHKEAPKGVNRKVRW